MDKSLNVTGEISPFPELQAWTRQLRRIASESLAMCPQFPDIAARFEAWWGGELADRPVFIASYNSDPSCPTGRHISLLRDDTHAWLQAKRRELEQQVRLGDALPAIRVDLGPACLSALVGGERELGADTAWTEPFIEDDWSNARNWAIDESDMWWQQMRAATRLVAADAVGSHLVCCPDLGGASDALLSMRGSEKLCMDSLDQPERIRTAMDGLYPHWRAAIRAMYQDTLDAGAGIIQWLGTWSHQPHVVGTCDFNYMLGPEQFRDVCLSDIERMARTIGRVVFHVDGPQATRHVDALLEIPQIKAIQYTPGAGTPSALPWISVFKRAQQRGRSVFLFCPAEEVGALCDALEPQGLALSPSGTGPQLEAAWDEVRQRFGPGNT